MAGTLGHARPHATPHGAGRQPVGAGARVLRSLVDAHAAAPASTSSTPTRERQARRNILAHYDLGNDFYAAVARSDDDVFVGALRRPLRRSRSPTRNRPNTTACSTSSRCAGARTRSGDRLRLGRLRGDRRARRPSRDRHLAVRRADRLRAGTTRRARDYAHQRRPAPAGLSRRARPLRRHRVDRDVRGGRRALLAGILPHDARRARARRPRLHPDHHHRRRPLRTLPHAVGLHPAIHLSRRHAGLAGALRRRRPTPPDSCSSACMRSVATTRRRSSAGLPRSTRRCRRSARRASTRNSSAAGASTWPTAPPASTRERPMSRSTRSCAT